DYDERKETIDAILNLFNGNSKFLYSEPGIFSIDITDFGYKFNIEIKRAGSQGIGHMKIFSYDLTITQRLTTELPNSKISLIHDSTLFDGVDERQISKALELAQKESTEKKFQYICLLNSDTVPYKDFSKGFGEVFKKSIVQTFSDSTEDGGLLGVRF
ncbi:MAG: DUF2326 domain-containing protein, partial [Nanoarchaeota archaeon]|nr:DUF2326 domain-containing protein [Nanoarchaeota archaeon]